MLCVKLCKLNYAAQCLFVTGTGTKKCWKLESYSLYLQSTEWAQEGTRYKLTLGVSRCANRRVTRNALATPHNSYQHMGQLVARRAFDASRRLLGAWWHNQRIQLWHYGERLQTPNSEKPLYM